MREPRATVATAVPLDASPGQLRALASLLNAIEGGRWDSLVTTFAKMERTRAELPDQLGHDGRRAGQPAAPGGPGAGE